MIQKPVALLLASLAFLGVLLTGSGCSGGSGGGIDKDYMANAEEQGKEKRQIFLRAGGNYDAMSAEDRKKYLSFFENETFAKEFWAVMANPPTSANPSSGGGSN